MGKNARALAEREFERTKLAGRLESVLLETSEKFLQDSQRLKMIDERRWTKEESLPFVSIIMPIRNEANFIERAITSILKQDWPAEKMEILVIDGMSNDGTRKIVKKLAAIDSRIKMLDNPFRIVPTAMNIGLKAARGDLFIRVDGHAEVEPDFVGESVRCLREHSQAWIVGGYIETVAEGFVGRSIASAMQSPIGVGNSRFRLGEYEGWVDTLAFGTHYKWIVDKIGYFDEELVRNQDDDFQPANNLGWRQNMDVKIHKEQIFFAGVTS